MVAEMTFRVYIAALRYSNFLFEGDVERLMPHLERAMEILPQFGEVGQGKTCSRTQSRSLPTPALMRMTSWLCLESLLDRQSCNVQHCNSMQQHYVGCQSNFFPIKKKLFYSQKKLFPSH